MLSRSRPLNNTLPTELLVMVFQNLLNVTHLEGKKRDIKTCLSVCKSWKVAAQEFFDGSSIKVDESSLEKLSRDLDFLVEKVKKITLVDFEGYKHIDYFRMYRIWFEKIIPSFSNNLTSVSIANGLPSLFLRDVRNVRAGGSVSIQNLYVIDFIRFLKLIPHLKELEITRIHKIESSSSSGVELRRTDSSANICLDILNLTSMYMDMNTLMNIITCLRPVQALYISVFKLNMNVPPEEFEEKEVLNDLQRAASGIPNFSIRFEYNYVKYVLKNDQEPEIDSSRSHLQWLL
ncbi:hypothetical protein BD770DRAFT_382076, partial [Pilaira anomala]